MADLEVATALLRERALQRALRCLCGGALLAELSCSSGSSCLIHEFRLAVSYAPNSIAKLRIPATLPS